MKTPPPFLRAGLACLSLAWGVPNLVLNPGFEGGDATLRDWSLDTWNTPSKAEWTGKGEGTYGSRCVRLESPNEKSRAGVSAFVTVVPGAKYRVRYAVRGEVATKDKATMRLTLLQKRSDASGPSVFYPGSPEADWRTVENLLVVPTNVTALRLDLFVYFSAGTVYFDDVEISPLDEKGKPIMKTTLTLPDMNQMLDEALAARDRSFDPKWNMTTGSGGGAGYHTVTKKTDRVHGTRDSADYAQLLLMRGKPADVERAEKILSKLCDIQVTNAESIHYGIWGWFAEEPPEAMRPADWNWADFIGARYAEILIRFGDKLSPELRERMKQALGHAARAIMKRDVGPGYTNICTMGAVVVMAATKVLHDPELLAYGRRRLNAQRKQMEFDGGVPEYNSPTYTIVMLMELERALRLVDDKAAREDAMWMNNRMWSLISEQFHPPTSQWAGGQSRVYSDWLDSGRAALLMQRTGVPIFLRAGTGFTPNPDILDFTPDVACPPEVRERFSTLAKSPVFTKQVWTRSSNGDPAVVLSTWMDADATLGSVNRETTWVQRRAIAGYLTHPEDFFSSYKALFLKDGKEFSGGRLTTVQKDNRLLGCLGLATGQGDWHISLDKPKNGIYTGTRLAFRMELKGRDARVTNVGGNVFELSAKGKKLVVHTGEAWFDGQPVTWEKGESYGMAWVECVLHDGSAISFHPSELKETLVPFALEVLGANEKVEEAGIETKAVSEGVRRVSWKPIAEGIAHSRKAE